MSSVAPPSNEVSQRKPAQEKSRPLRGTALYVPSQQEKDRNSATLDLYASLIGQNSVTSLIWTGVESGNPLTRHEEYRWDSLNDQGLFDPKRRATLIQELKKLGIRNIRLGISNHRIEASAEDSWHEHDGLIADLAGAGLRISLDLHHFGVEDRFRVVNSSGWTIPESSYYLHKDWPDYFASFCRAAVQRYSSQVVAVTLVNEPETTVGFNSEMWNGAHPGWGSKLHGKFYVDRSIRLAIAAVKARTSIEEVLAEKKQRLLFIHPEAAVYKPYWQEFNRIVRFFPSDLILGDSWLLTADLDKLSLQSPDELSRQWRQTPPSERSSLRWAIEQYVTLGGPSAQTEARLDRLVTMLRELTLLHKNLIFQHRTTMKTDTIYGVDYYAHNEDKDRTGRGLSAQPQHYKRQIVEGRRAGLHPLLVTYFNRYKLPIMVAETGTPYFKYGVEWHEQMLFEAARAAEDGVPLVGYVIYPAIDTWGWETALSVAKKKTLLNPGGIFDQNLRVRPFARAFMDGLTPISSGREQLPPRD